MTMSDGSGRAVYVCMDEYWYSQGETGEDYQWMQYTPCNDVWAVTTDSWEVSNWEWVRMQVSDEMNRKREDAEYAIEDMMTKDWELEKASAMRELRCMWANFAPEDDGCEDYEVFMANYCEGQGGMWDSYMWECNKPDDWKMKDPADAKKEKAMALTKMMKLNQAKTMGTYSVTIDEAALAKIWEPVAENEEMGEMLFESIGEELKTIAEDYGPSVEEWAKTQAALEEQAKNDTMEHMIDNIIVDNKSIREHIEGAANYKALNKKDDFKEEIYSDDHQFSKTTVSWEGPTLEEMKMQIDANVAPMVDDMGAAVADLYESTMEWQEKSDEMRWNMTHEARWALEDSMGEIVNATGSFIKGTLAEEIEIKDTMLATKTQPACANNAATVGVCSGLVGAFVGFAAFAILNRKKKIIAAEQPLL